MATAAKKSTLCKVRYKTGPVNIGEILEITPPPLSREVKEVTNSDSSEAYSEWVPTTRDGGEITARVNMVASDAGQQAILASYATDTLETYEIVHPDGTVICEFSGYVVGYKPAIGGQKDSLENTITWRTSGKPSYFAAASTGLTSPYFTISESAVITPAAAGDVYDYVATVLNPVASVTVTPTATAGVITVNGNIVATGVASSAITLGTAGTNTTVTIVVTETGKSSKTYTIRIARAA